MRGETARQGRGRGLQRAFQSTPLMRGETRTDIHQARGGAFQSTPLMRGETLTSASSDSFLSNFNPLPSCEGRPPKPQLLPFPKSFNPLPSCEGRPLQQGSYQRHNRFNPLPSCEGRRYLSASRQPPSRFNPLPSCEGRLLGKLFQICVNLVSIHSPHARGDKICVS